MSPPAAIDLSPGYLREAESLRDNPAQWTAYDSEGHCVILAGPGSGKTKTLTVKMARMLAENVSPPRGIACLTYSSECVRELRNRLDRLGVRASQNVFIGTLHAFCLKNVLAPYCALAGLDIPQPITVASPEEQSEMFADALAKAVSADERPDTWKSRFDRYRRVHIDRDDPTWRASDEDAAKTIEMYERLLRRQGKVDFDDMVRYGWLLIRDHEWIRRALRARFPIMVVDEYQDLGVALHHIVLKLCIETGIRLLAVGDPDQSVYGFSGAEPHLLYELADSPGVEVVKLRFNYRCGARIIKASTVALGEQRDYEARGGNVGRVEFHECPNGIEEQTEKVCRDLIPACLAARRGRRLGDIAVLYRDKHVGKNIAEQVINCGMKFVRSDGGVPYPHTPLVRWVEDCASWCCGGWRSGTPRLSDLLGRWRGFVRLAEDDRAWRRRRLSVVRFLFGQRDPQSSAHDWIGQLDADVIGEYLRQDPSLRDEAEAIDKLQRTTTGKGAYADWNVERFAGQAGSPDHLNLITLHSAKGLEFDVVIMIGLEQGLIPPFWAKTAESKHEPRRLFYVGLTRARHEVHLLYSGWYANQYGRTFQNGPSEFVLEVKQWATSD